MASSTERASSRPQLHKVIPPLIMGTATFNTQYVDDPFDLPAASVVSRALDLGVKAFDTSPYYGPSEIILGNALAHRSITSRYNRSDYFLVTKAGRLSSPEFDYSPEWVRYSIYRSLERLHTEYLDLVYMHDVEFVSSAEVLAAVRELRRLRDEEGVIRYVGISGYPVRKLCELAEMILRETGEPLDGVLSYGHYTIQNTTLGSEDVLRRFREAGVDVVLNASMLGMGLLTTRGADNGPMASWHPSPVALRRACQGIVPVAQEAGEKLEVVAIRWALESWAEKGAELGTSATNLPEGTRIGVSVMGTAYIDELEETCRVFNSVLDGLAPEDDDQELTSRREQSRERREKIRALVEEMWNVLGNWKDYSWDSPPEGFVNKRNAADMGVVPDDGVLARRIEKQKGLVR
ncbi:Aldo/keto reductase [Poronia punctata]|nr:Aldo/keto reductase [Poronia punctata]